MEWQPIKTAPKDTPILGYGNIDGEINGYFGVGIVVMRYSFGSWSAEWTDTYSVAVDPTHWMHLPEPPK